MTKTEAESLDLMRLRTMSFIDIADFTDNRLDERSLRRTLTDLRHRANANGLDFAAIDKAAYCVYLDECGMLADQTGGN